MTYQNGRFTQSMGLPALYANFLCWKESSSTALRSVILTSFTNHSESLMLVVGHHRIHFQVRLRKENSQSSTALQSTTRGFTFALPLYSILIYHYIVASLVCPFLPFTIPLVLSIILLSIPYGIFTWLSIL